MTHMKESDSNSTPAFSGECKVKQLLIIRRDLKMRRGKEISQGSHACLNSFLDLQGRTTPEARGDEARWFEQGQTKITVKVDSEEELLYTYNKAVEEGLPCALIMDEGRTEFKGPTRTAAAIGPAAAELIDKITGELKPY